MRAPSKMRNMEKKYFLVAIDNYSAWPDALFLHKPTTKKVIEFLKNYVAQYGIPKQIRSDPGSVFTSEEFKTFCRQFQIKHVTCPVRDHRGNGKIERLIRTLNERLRTNRNIILKRDKSGLSEILYALRMGKKADGSSPFEKLYGREPNTVKSNIINKIKNVSENDPKVEFTQSDFEEEVDSTILVRERTKGSKLEGQYKRKIGKVIKESAHTITFLPKNSKKEVVYAKRDVAKASETKPAEEQKAGCSKIDNETGELEESSDDETYKPPEDTEDEETVTTDNTSEEMETTATMETADNQKEAQPAEKANPPETTKIQEMGSAAEGATKDEKSPKKKAVQASVEWSNVKRREPRKRRPTERYGIDVIMNVTEEQAETEN